MYFASQNGPTEGAYTSYKTYADPFNDVQLDVVVTCPDGSEQCMPAFWAGENTWRVRYAASEIGKHHVRSVCSDAQNDRLHGQETEIDVSAYIGKNPLYQH